MGNSPIFPLPGQPTTGPDATFKAGSIPNQVSFSFQNVDPPSQTYIQRDDQLAIQSVSQVGPDTIFILARILIPVPPLPGQPDEPGTKYSATQPPPGGSNIINMVFTFTTNAAPTTKLTKFPLLEGYLLSVSAVCQGANFRGQTFVRASIFRVQPNVNIVSPSAVLFEDYVTQQQWAGWPDGPQRYPSDGPGWLNTVGVTQPAAGADWTQTFTSNVRTRLQSGNAQLVTSAVAGTRIVRMQVLDNGGFLVWQSSASQTIPASTTAQVSFSSGQVTVVTDTKSVNIALPSPLLMVGAWQLQTSTTGILAGDQWSNINLITEQWIDGI